MTDLGVAHLVFGETDGFTGGVEGEARVVSGYARQKWGACGGDGVAWSVGGETDTVEDCEDDWTIKIRFIHKLIIAQL